ncbi:MAG: gliding motility-associated C-terminal domain-containing protein [Bacteroidales bacterium]
MGDSFEWRKIASGTAIETNPISGATTNSLSIAIPTANGDFGSGNFMEWFSVKAQKVYGIAPDQVTCTVMDTLKYASVDLGDGRGVTIKDCSDPAPGAVPSVLCEKSQAVVLTLGKAPASGVTPVLQDSVAGAASWTTVAASSFTWTAGAGTPANGTFSVKKEFFTNKVAGTPTIRYFRVQNGTTYSQAVAITINPYPVITKKALVVDPLGAAVCERALVKINAAATTANIGTLSYQWRLWSDKSNLSNTSPISGATTNTLNISPIPVSYHGKQFYVVYTATAPNATTCNTVDSSTAVQITVNARPDTTGIITKFLPSTLNVCRNTDVALTLTTKAPANSSLSYQWYYNGNPEPGEISATYNILGATSAMAGTYKVVVKATNTTTSCDSMVSSSVVVTVTACSSDTITGPGPKKTVEACATENPKALTLTISNYEPATKVVWTYSTDGGVNYNPASGTSSCSGASITGSCTYTPTATEIKNSGTTNKVLYYRATVSRSGYADKTTCPLVYTIYPPLPSTAITTNLPAAVSLCEATSNKFTVVATAISGYTFSYFWKADANVIAGATAASYTLPSASISDNQKKYKVGVVKTNNTTLCSDTLFSKECVLSVYPKAVKASVSFNPTTVAACEKDEIVLRPTITPATPAMSGSTYKYNWYKASTLLATPTKDTIKFASVSSSDAATYKLDVITITDKACKDSSSASLTLSVSALPTLTVGSITALPSSATVCSKFEDVKFTVTPTNVGTGNTLTYQWKNAADKTNVSDVSGKIIGSTTSSLTLVKPDYATYNGKSYYCVVTNTSPSACFIKDSSASKTININELPAVPTAFITNLPATKKICQNSTETLTVAVAAAPSGISYEYIWYSGSSSTSVNTYKSTTNVPSLVLDKNNLGTANVGTTYYKVRVKATKSSSCTDTSVASAICEVGVVACGLDQILDDATSSKKLIIACNKENAKAIKLSIASQEAPNKLTWQVSSDSTNSSLWADALTTGSTKDGTTTCTNTSTTSCTFTPDAAKIANSGSTAKKLFYRVKVERPSFTASFTNVFTYIVNPSPAKASITTDLKDMAGCENSKLTLDITASAAANTTISSYYWTKIVSSVSTVVANGATANSYTIASLATSDNNNQYKVGVVSTNADGCFDTMFSAIKTLSVHPKAVKANVSFSPTTVAACEKDEVVLRSTINPAIPVASGSTYKYNWYKASTLLATPTKDTIKFASVSSSDAATYKLDVITITDKACKDSSSASLTLSVSALPTLTVGSITALPSSATVCSKFEDVKFTVTPTNVGTGNTLTYQWKNAADKTNVSDVSGKITGSTTSSLTLVKPDYATYNGKSYYCVVKNTSPSACFIKDSSASKAIVVNLLPTAPTFTKQPTDKNICQNSTDSIVAAITEVAGLSYRYLWYSGSNNNIANINTYQTTTAKPSLVMSKSSTVGTSTLGTTYYALKVEVTNENGCKDTFASNVIKVLILECSSDQISGPSGATSIVACAQEAPKKLNLTIASYAAATSILWEISSDNGATFATANGTSSCSGAGPFTGSCDYTPTVAEIANGGSSNVSLLYRAVIQRTGFADKTTGNYSYIIYPRPGKATISTDLPATTAICEGLKQEFKVVATAPAETTLSYFWKENTTVMSGTTASNTITAVPISKNGNQYRVGVITTNTTTSCKDTINSQVCTLTVHPKAVKATVSFNHNLVEICQGADTVLRSTITPATPAEIGSTYKYNWYKASTLLATPTKDTIKFASVSSSDAATYKLDVITITDKACKDSSSASLTLSVSALPTINAISIASTPTNATVCDAREDIVLRASATFSAGTPSYQWKDKSSHTPLIETPGKITGTTTSTLTFVKPSRADYDGKEYYCVITNTNAAACALSDSTTAVKFTVNALPGKPDVKVLPTMNICQDATDTLKIAHATKKAGLVYSYDWYYGTTNTTSTTFIKTTTDSLVVFEKAALDLALRSANIGTLYFMVKVVATNANNCTDTISSNVAKIVIRSCGADKITDNTGLNNVLTACPKDMPKNITLNIASQEAPNKITWQLSSDSTNAALWTNAVTTGANQDGTTTCSGSSTGTCTFTPDAAKIANRGTTTLRFYYRAIVERPSFAKVTTNVFTYIVNPSPAKASITKDLKDTAGCENSKLTLDITASAATNTTISSYYWTKIVSSLSTVVANGATTNSYTIASLATSDNNNKYKVGVVSTNADGCFDTAFSAIKMLTVHPKAINPTLKANCDTTCLGGEIKISTSVSPKDPATPNKTYTYAWWNANGTQKIGTTAGVITVLDTVLTIHSTDVVGNGAYLFRNIVTTDKACSDSAEILVGYTVFPLPTISFTDKNLNETLPEICEKASIQLTFKAAPTITGASTVAYQWYKTNGTTIAVLKDGTTADGSVFSGTQTSTLDLSNAAVSDATAYYCKIIASTDRCSLSDSSKVATLTVNAKPKARGLTISPLPKSLLLRECQGKDSIYVKVSGLKAGETLAYQWYKNLTAISGASNSVLKIDPTTLSLNTEVKYSLDVILISSKGCRDTVNIASTAVTVIACAPELAYPSPGNGGEDTPSLTPQNPNSPVLLCEGTKIESTLNVKPNNFSAINYNLTQVLWTKTTDTLTGPWTTNGLSTSLITGGYYSLALPINLSSTPGVTYYRALIERTNTTTSVKDTAYTAIYSYIVASKPGKATGLKATAADTTVCIGKAVTFTATSTPPTYITQANNLSHSGVLQALQYSWFKNDALIAGSTNTTGKYAISSVALSDAGVDSVRVISSVLYTIAAINKTCYDTVSPMAKVKLTVDALSLGGSIKDALSASSAILCTSATMPTLTLSGHTSTAKILRWELSSAADFSANLSTLPNSTAGSAVTSLPLTLADLNNPQGNNLSSKNYIRAVVKNGCCDSVYSSTYTLQLLAEPKVANLSPKTTVICQNGGTIKLTTPTPPLASSYTWMVLKPTATSFVDAGTSNATSHTVTSTISSDTGLYRYFIKAQNDGSTHACADAHSDTVEVRVVADIKISDFVPALTLASTIDTIQNNGKICMPASSWSYTLNKNLPQGVTITALSYKGSDGIVGSISPVPTTLPYDLGASFFKDHGGAGAFTFTLSVKTGNCSAVDLNVLRINIINQPQGLKPTVNSPICTTPVSIIATPTLASTEVPVWEYTTKLTAGATPKPDFSSPVRVVGGTNFDIISSFQPLLHADTTYYFRVVNKINVSKNAYACVDSISDTIKVVVKALPLAPVVSVSPGLTICEGDNFALTAIYRAQSYWKESINGGLLREIANSELEIKTAPQALDTARYKFTTGAVVKASDAEGVYTYVVKDSVEDCASSSTTVSIKVLKKPVAGNITAVDKGQICVNNNQNIKATNFIPASDATFDWEVLSDTTKVSTLNTTYTQRNVSENYSMQFTDTNTYFIHYIVSNGSACKKDTSAWLQIKAYPSPTFAYDANTISNIKICEGSSIKVNFDFSIADSLYIYSGASTITPSTAKADTVISLSGFTLGKASVDLIPKHTPNTYYIFEVKNSKVANPGCSKVTGTQFVVQVDDSTVAGKLIFSNATATNAGKVLVIDVGQNANLKVNADKGTTYSLESVNTKTGTAANWSNFAAIDNSTTVHPSFIQGMTTSDMDTTYYRVKVSNGQCNALYTDTVKAVVVLSDKPHITTTDPVLCAGSEDTLLIGGSAAILGNIDYTTIKWQRRGPLHLTPAPQWEEVTLSALPPDNDNRKVKDKIENENAGAYEYRFVYKIRGSATVDTSSKAAVKIDALSVGGKMLAANNTICVNSGENPLLRVVSSVGTIQNLYFSTNSKENLPWAATRTTATSPAQADNLYEVKDINADSGWYCVKVQNGVCPAIYSDSILVSVISRPVAGTITFSPNPVCLQGSSTATLSGYKGNIVAWLYRSDSTKDYQILSNTTATATFATVVDRTLVRAIVSTGGTCANDTTPMATLEVYDTLYVSKQPIDKIVSGTGWSAVFSVDADVKPNYYDQGVSLIPFAMVTPKYRWEYSADHGATYTAFTSDAISTKYSGAFTANLTIQSEFYTQYPTAVYRCKITDQPSNCRTIYTDTARITPVAALAPGNIATTSEAGCYFYGDTAYYIVKNYAGDSVYFHWYLTNTLGSAIALDQIPGLSYLVNKPVGDTVKIFANSSIVDNYTSITAYALDKQNPNESENKKATFNFCFGNKIAQYFPSDTVCVTTDAVMEVFYNANVPSGMNSKCDFSYKKKTESIYTPITTSTTFSGDATGVTIAPVKLTVKGPKVGVDNMSVKAVCYWNYSSKADTTLYATLRIDQPITIKRSLVNDTLCEGQALRFDLGIERPSEIVTPVTYQWFSTNKNLGRIIQVTPEYTTLDTLIAVNKAAVGATDSGIWYVNIGNSCNIPKKSDTAYLWVDIKAAVLSDPSNLAICSGASASFEAQLNDARNLAYQWQHWVESDALGNGAWMNLKNGAPITGATTSVLTINPATLKDSGSYRLRAISSSTCGDTVYSKGAKLIIDSIPNIIQQPSKLVLKVNGNGGFRVNVTSSENPTNVNSYLWYVCLPGKTAYQSVSDLKVITPAYVDTLSGETTNSLKVLIASLGMDSTWVYCKITNNCGSIHTDSVLLRVNNKLSFIRLINDPICENDSAKIGMITNIRPEAIRWIVSTDKGTSWKNVLKGSVPGISTSSYDTITKEESDGAYNYLYITKVPYAMNGYRYACIFNENRVGEDTVYSDTTTLVVNQAVHFVCTDKNQALTADHPIVVLGSTQTGSAVLNYNGAACSFLPTDDGSYNYIYQQQNPGSAVFNQVQKAIAPATSYTFTPASDTGVYTFRLLVENGCGSDTALVSIRVIEKIKSDSLHVFTDDPADITIIPDDEYIVKDENFPLEHPKNELIKEVCEGGRVKLAASCAAGLPSDFHWQIFSGNAWNEVAYGGTYTLSGDTLVVYPVDLAMNNDRFRMIFNGAHSDANDTSAIFKLQLSSAPETGLKLTITDANSAPGATVTLSVNGTYTGSHEFCWYQYNPTHKVSFLLACGNTTTYELTNSVQVALHDSTLYYCQIKDVCGHQQNTDTNLLRVYQELKVDWMGRVIDYNPDTAKDVPTGEILLGLDPIGGAQQKADYYICEQNQATLTAEALQGFVEDDECTWAYSIDSGKNWVNIPGNNTPYFASGLQMIINPVSMDMDGRWFRTIGSAGNGAYKDSTVPLVLHVGSALSPNISMVGGSEEIFCKEHNYTFEVSPSVKGMHYTWLLDTLNGSLPFVVNGDSAIYPYGKATYKDSGRVVTAIIHGLCGKDTVRSIIKVRKPLVVKVTLPSDSACFGSLLSLTAQTQNAGVNPMFVWFVDDLKVDGVISSTISLTNLSPGSHKVRVHLTASSETCTYPDTASAQTLVLVHSLPTVTANISDTLIKTGSSVNLYAQVSLGSTPEYHLLWTPEKLVVEPTRDTTSSIIMTERGVYRFVATLTDKNACTATDSVSLTVIANFILDSVPTIVVIPPIFEDGSDGYDTTFVHTFYTDTIHLKVCKGSEAFLTLCTTGGESPISYTWMGVIPFYPYDYAPNYKKDSTFGFSLDGNLSQFQCRIVDATGAELMVYVLVEYYKPQPVYIEVKPKMHLGKYYEKQAIYFEAKPNRFDAYHFYKQINGSMVYDKSSPLNLYVTSFQYEKEQDNWVWVTVKDKNACRSFDSVHVELLPLPNTMIMDDPLHPKDGVIFPDFEVEVINSWGQVVKKMDKGKGWDGTDTYGKPIVAGTYYYKVKIPTMDGFTYMTGAVTIFRKK